jgi:DnaJ-class molecular chaperone
MSNYDTEEIDEFVLDLEDDEDVEDDELGICPSCSGSGEGQYEGTRCRTCKGRGES